MVDRYAPLRDVQEAEIEENIREACRAYSAAAREGCEDIDAPDYSCGGVETETASYWEACKALLGVTLEAPQPDMMSALRDIARSS